MNRLFSLLLAAAPLWGQDARTIVDEAQRRIRAASQRYEGTLEVQDTKQRKISTKRWIYERLGSAGESKAVLRFTAPAEVKGVALLVLNHSGRASDQWMWTPAVGRERRVAFQDRSTRFFGTDFTFEDLEERDADRASYKLLATEDREGARCWKIESTPKPEAHSQYTRLLLWIRQDNYAFAAAECYARDQLIRRIRYGNLERVQNIWTAKTIEVADLKRNSTTVLQIDRLQYNLKLDEAGFTLQGLRREN